MELTDRIKGIPALKATLRDSDTHLERFKGAVAVLPSRSTQELLSRIETTDDPLMLWALHLALDSRNVPPCLRTPYRDEHPQLGYVTWLADMHWLRKRHPHHKPLYGRWCNLFTHAPASESWHKVAHWIYMQSRGKSAYYFSKGLALTDQQRQPLAVLISYQMRADRQLLKALPAYREKLLAHAVNHRDRSGRLSAQQIADGRTETLRVYLLAGRSKADTAAWLHRLGGMAITRQAVANRIRDIQAVTGLKKL